MKRLHSLGSSLLWMHAHATTTPITCSRRFTRPRPPSTFLLLRALWLGRNPWTRFCTSTIFSLFMHDIILDVQIAHSCWYANIIIFTRLSADHRWARVFLRLSVWLLLRSSEPYLNDAHTNFSQFYLSCYSTFVTVKFSGFSSGNRWIAFKKLQWFAWNYFSLISDRR